jgi:hypothetical protein
VYSASGADALHAGDGYNPVPLILSVTPASANEGDAGDDVAVVGVGFMSTATATFNGNSRTLTYNSSTSVDVTLLTADFATSGTYVLKITNPIPGGGSASYNFVVEEPAFASFAWDPATHGADITLSNSDYTATRGTGNANNFRSVRGTLGKSSGKWYWELAITSGPSVTGEIIIGIGQSGLSQTSYPGSSGTSYGLQSRPTSTPLAWNNGSSAAVSGTATNFVTNDVVGLAFDATGGTLDVYVNNVLVQSWSSISAGTYYPAVGLYNNPRAVTIQPTLTYTPPTGYSQLGV